MVATAVGGPGWFPARPAIIPHPVGPLAGTAIISQDFASRRRSGPRLARGPRRPSHLRPVRAAIGLPGSGLSHSVYERHHRVADTECAFGLLVVILIVVAIAAIVLVVLIIGRR